MSKIINFHEVHDAVWFENVIIYLKKRYRMMNVNHLYDFYYKQQQLHNACLITVDDGHLSSYKIIYPILKKYNVPAVFFVSPQIAQRKDCVNFWFQEMADYDQKKIVEIISNETIFTYDFHSSYILNLNKLPVDILWKVIKLYQVKYNISVKAPLNMAIEQIKQVDQEGLVEIGAHTMLHPFLATESDGKAEEEIKESICQLEKILQHPIRTFAYPNGTPISDFGKREINILKETSVKLAFSTYAHNISKSDDTFAIPRYGLSCGSLRFIAIKLFLGKYYLLLKKSIKKIER